LVKNAHDNRNRLLAVADKRLGTPSFNLLSHEYHYRESGNRNYEKRAFQTAGGSVCTADLYAYDDLYRVVDTKYGVTATTTPNPIGPGNQPAAIDFAAATETTRQELKLDLLANRVQFAETGKPTLKYGGYNGTNAASYAADPRNRTTSIKDGTTTITPTWDDNGALNTDATRTYTFDAENHLLKVEPTNPGPADKDTRATYAYGPLGRRARRIVQTYDGATATWSTKTTQYYYDGWSVVEETDDSGDLTASYLNGRDLDEPLAAAIPGVNNGDPVYFHQNSLGNVELVTDALGNVLERYRYDLHGNVTVLDAGGTVKTTAPDSPYLFTGRRFDKESGLYYFRNRYYSPLLGKFISPDPLDYVDGMNVYAYVNGNTANLVDPMGTTLRTSEATGAMLADLWGKENIIVRDGGQETLISFVSDEAYQAAMERVRETTEDVTGEPWFRTKIGELMAATASSTRHTWFPGRVFGDKIGIDDYSYVYTEKCDVENDEWRIVYISSFNSLPSVFSPSLVSRFTGGNGTVSGSQAVQIGMTPSNPAAGNHVVEHVVGQHTITGSGSQYLAASTRMGGAPGFEGDLVWIDVSKLRDGQVLYYEDIVKASEKFLAQKPGFRSRFLAWKNRQLGRTLKIPEGEVAILGEVPPHAVVGKWRMGLGTGMKVGGTALLLYAVSVDSNAFWFSEKKDMEAARIAGAWGGAAAGGMVGGEVGAGIGAGFAIAVGQFGPQVGLPEEFITVPTCSAIGRFVGGLVGGTKGYRDGEKIGLAYYDFVVRQLNK
jgi:RHS repeat-associated protein